MKFTKQITALILLFLCSLTSSAQENTVYIKVHFLYGSKPAKAFKHQESKWFGGKSGGHVGIELANGRILNFLPGGKCPLFSNNHKPQGHFSLHTEKSFYGMFGTPPDSVKKCIFYIPADSIQLQLLDSMASLYLEKPPYDYAVFGMRCAAATADVLGKTGILKDSKRAVTWKKYFYPARLRKKLFKLAAKHNWRFERQHGSQKRIWEKN